MPKILLSCLILLLGLQGCVTATVGEQTMLSKDGEANATVLFSISTLASSVVTRKRIWIMNLETKQELEVHFGEAFEDHQLKKIRLPAGIYAVVEIQATTHTSQEIVEHTQAFLPEEAPWFLAQANKTTYLGTLMSSLNTGYMATVLQIERAKTLLRDSGQSTDFEVLQFAISNTKKDLLPSQMKRDSNR
jgi:hypothetical protein